MVDVLPFIPLLTAFIVALVATGGFTAMVRAWALQRAWVDCPEQEARKLHAAPTPSVGGIAIFGGALLGLVTLALFPDPLPFEAALPSIGLGVAATVMVATGFYDDTRGLSFKQKFAIQVVVAYILLHAGFRFDVSGWAFVGDDSFYQALYSIPLSMLWMVGVMNAVNLIDGLDGLASGVAIIAFAALAAVYGVQGALGSMVIAIIMIGALAGFLYHNFNPASIFMGDSGSLFLGCMLAAYSLHGAQAADPLLSFLVPIVALGLPVGDTLLTVVRRLRSDRAVCAPDSDHVHHRLRESFGDRTVALLLYGVSAWFGLAAIVMAVSPRLVAYVAFGVTALAALAGIGALGYVGGKRRVSTPEEASSAVYHGDGDGRPLLSSDCLPVLSEDAGDRGKSSEVEVAESSGVQ